MKIDYSFKVDGFSQSINYYRSEFPMDTESMPPATKSGIADLEYSDQTASKGKLYYVRFGATKSGIEKISNESLVFARNISNYSAFFLNKVDTNDLKGGSNLSPAGSPTIDSGGVYFNGAGDYLSRLDNNSTTFQTGDLTIELIFKCERIGSYVYEQALVDNFIGGQGGWQIGLRSDGRAFVYMNSPNGYVMNSPSSLSDGYEHHLAWVRRGSDNYLFIDGIQVATYTDQRDFTAKTYFAIAAQVNSRNLNYDFKGWIRKIGVSKQALYLENFIPDMN